MQSFELKRILQFYTEAKAIKLRTVMASLVGLKGSSYRKPGVRMLFAEDGRMAGAISGGCVEKEIFRRAAEVFTTGISKVISYDGRYRLGCEGFLYILIEKFEPSEDQILRLHTSLNKREAISIASYYKEKTEVNGNFGSVFTCQKTSFTACKLPKERLENANLSSFRQQTKTAIQLLLIGSGHDTVTLSTMASGLGWEVKVICSVQSNKTVVDFPAAKDVVATSPELFDYDKIDLKTAVVLMNHNFAKDLHYLIHLAKHPPRYTGILGSVRRWNRLQDELLELDSDIDLDFLESVYSPAGLDIGSETSEEISLAILSEIQAVFFKKDMAHIGSLSVVKDNTSV